LKNPVLPTSVPQHYPQVQELTVSAEKQTHGFQAEVSRLLHLMIHSLYSNREIFLRELISNASDACDKRRFQALDNPALLEQGDEPKITLSVDKDAGTLTIADNGIGMSEEEVIDNLGTIARSGTEKFLANLSGDQKKDAQLIGQFGVGFYSAFIVADTVTVETRKAGEEAANGVRWESDGKGEFSVETIVRDESGTAVILHLRDDARDFLDDFKIRQVIGQYSDHVAFPIVLVTPQDGDDEAKEETLNSATALWQRSRSEVTDEEYQNFYKHISHDFQDALTWSHNKVEGKLEYTSLLYIPARAPFDLYQREANRGLKLYVQRVFIMDDAEQFLPQYLRFIKGVIDAPDLPLNVSRELLQDYGPVQKIRAALTKRVLQMLKKLSNDDDQYATFWAQFGQVIKEGVAEDRDNQQAIAALLRFATSSSPDSVATSLDQYLENKPAEQDSIYYLLADTPSAARQSPHLEVFRKKGIEVLLLSDPVDEWMVGYLESYKDVKLVNAARGELDLGDDEQANNDDPLIQRLSGSLSEHVEAVRATTRLVDSPACLVLAEDQLGPQMRRMLEAAGQPVPENKPVLEVNLSHDLLAKLSGIDAGERFDDLAALLLDQAMLAEGQLPKDPAATARRMHEMLVKSVGS
jgi:molecular chaperone HtpG